ncbi:Dynein heavy chain 7, axonemal [Monoraphidium neglectum]|uniref:Dynein heavy chain 7, axonemal n=1 Tax=Monoraphidium neglectum TaxID=145388 RepID=A0A0D2NT83_9CHLO|nr:Dynein heavy chain 7, axonemal [Monoraphidium neglectum]KIZ07416.1 Dynein heavy chain 7, axonemal [Monoraphidium neglectum]|eukprot:XP_013906435.1 Dynein heavy chain 7, axonemal [Monoraphidium neglectum]
MAADWEGLAFELGPWRETGTFILKGAPIEEAQMLLDDHVVKAQAMSSSPASRPFVERIGPWEAKLRRFQDILEEWLRCQGKWLYLQPIFGAEEIMRHIPREGGAFRTMDEAWRGIMERVRQEPLMLSVADWPGLLEELQSCSAQLEVVERGLNDFLDTKKMAFPRFFFLSNDELLEILAEARDPIAVQPFVKKCFEAVKELVFAPPTGDVPGAGPLITGCVSVEGEKIDFLENVDPTAEGGVERWLLRVESALKQALHRLTRDALAAYVTTPRHQWILQWPGQTVHWTRHVTDAIQSAGAKGLTAYAAKCTQDLNKIVGLVRGSLTSLERATCGALVVIDVHARDVVSFMAEEGVEDLRDFKWESQLRYYWETQDEPPSGVKGPVETLVVRMINAEALYGYEYLGNSGRLVITPLTDRRVHPSATRQTLSSSSRLGRSKAARAVACTGKTETTKDLSKALAMQCVVFNCSDGLDYKAMGKFFKGLACCGAWACFDEFNRIDLEVLSVVAQQVLTIVRAKAAKARNFMFDGTDIPLVPTCNVFITMNPGYAGRSELPDNLKALFRDVAMMVPDYAMIAEIMLYSYGYLDARALARKLVQTYRLCSEQLSSQDHYDYGMRAVMSVLRAAGSLKRAFPAAGEDVLMLRAIRDVNVPKFLDQDVPLFNGILSDLFPGVDPPDVDYVALRAALADNCARAGLQPLEPFLVKAVQLYEMILVRHGLMLVGASYGMKTTAYRKLAGALSDMAARGQGGEVPVKLLVLNPKAVTMGQLYGQEDPVSLEWTDGVLPALFRGATRDTSPDRKWLVFDGPVDALWIENMNTVLDDNKKLCLNSGEIIAMQGLMNLIFEVADLSVASPATVSRCGMVYVQPDLLGWRPVFDSWLAALPAAITSEDREELSQLAAWLLPPCLRMAAKGCPQVLAVHEINLAVSCMRLVEAHLDDLVRSEALAADTPPEKRSALLQCTFLFSLVWSVGANTDGEGRAKFDAALRRLIASAAGQGGPPPELAAHITAPGARVAVPFPEGRSVYDFVLDSSKLKWQGWTDRLDAAPINPDAEYTSIIVPTTDTLRYTYLLDVLARAHRHVLLVGPTGKSDAPAGMLQSSLAPPQHAAGTGKTAYVKRHLASGLPAASFVPCLLNFSAQTSANTTQDVVDGRLDKRRRGVWGPAGGRRMVPEQYGAQPPIELLRQWMDHGGWYDRKELAFKTLEGLQFAAAMGPPGGGRNAVTGRFLRHFSVISVTAFDRDNLSLIFSALTDWWLKKWSYGQNITRLAKPLVAATLDVYEQVQSKLLPTPAKSHYTFNLRDVSKAFQV